MSVPYSDCQELVRQAQAAAAESGQIRAQIEELLANNLNPDNFEPEVRAVPSAPQEEANLLVPPIPLEGAYPVPLPPQPYQIQIQPPPASRFQAPPITELANNMTQDVEIQYTSRVKLNMSYLTNKLAKRQFANPELITRILRDFFYIVSQYTENVASFGPDKKQLINSMYNQMKAKLLPLANNDENITGLLNEAIPAHLNSMFEYIDYIQKQGNYSPQDIQRNTDVQKLDPLVTKLNELTTEYNRKVEEEGIASTDLLKEIKTLEKTIKDIENKWSVNKDSPLRKSEKIANLQGIIDYLTALMNNPQYEAIYKMQKRTAAGEPIPNKFVGSVASIIEAAEKKKALIEGTRLAQGEIDVSGIRTKGARIRALREKFTRNISSKEKEFRDRQASLERDIREQQTLLTKLRGQLLSATSERKPAILQQITNAESQIAAKQNGLKTLNLEKDYFERGTRGSDVRKPMTMRNLEAKLKRNIQSAGRRTYRNKNRRIRK
jgi:hypothetical protein